MDAEQNGNTQRLSYKNEGLIKGDLPEVLTFNFEWPGNENGAEPASSNVLKVLGSLPQTFDVKDIFSHPLQQNEKYVLRGFIC